jgi:hypothetical protein
VSTATPQIKVGDKFKQITELPDGTRFKRVIEITGRATLSSPVNFRILQNDRHPHRAGKHGSIRTSELLRKYYPA